MPVTGEDIKRAVKLSGDTQERVLEKTGIGISTQQYIYSLSEVKQKHVDLYLKAGYKLIEALNAEEITAKYIKELETALTAARAEVVMLRRIIEEGWQPPKTLKSKQKQ